MVKQSKAAREIEAIKKLDDSALIAQEKITQAAEKAQQMIDDACTTATATLNEASRLPDRRNLNGSYQWSRNDQRSTDKRIGLLEVGQAKREEQIIGLIDDTIDIKNDIVGLRKEVDDIRELIIDMKDFCLAKIEGNQSDYQKDKTRTLQYILGVVVGLIITFLSGIVFAYFKV